MSRKKLIRISTVPTSLNTFLRGQLEMLSFHFEVVAVSSPDAELKELGKREGVRTVLFRWNGIFHCYVILFL